MHITTAKVKIFHKVYNLKIQHSTFVSLFSNFYLQYNFYSDLHVYFVHKYIHLGIYYLLILVLELWWLICRWPIWRWLIPAPTFFSWAWIDVPSSGVGRWGQPYGWCCPRRFWYPLSSPGQPGVAERLWRGYLSSELMLPMFTRPLLYGGWL